MGGSRALEDDAFDDVGDVFALVDGGLNDFEDFFPLDDLDGIFLFIEQLGDERAAEAIAIVFVAVDLDAVLEGFLRLFQRANGHLTRVRRLSVPQPRYLAEMVSEHKLIVKAVARSQPDAAEVALRHHLRMVLSELDAIRGLHPDYFEDD